MDIDYKLNPLGDCNIIYKDKVIGLISRDTVAGYQSTFKAIYYVREAVNKFDYGLNKNILVTITTNKTLGWLPTFEKAVNKIIEFNNGELEISEEMQRGL